MQTEPHTAILRPDAKGRITLGKLAEGVSSFHVSRDKKGRLVLEPYTEIPARERWLFQNPEALESVLKGIEQAKSGELHDLGSFARYADDEDGT